MLPGFPPGVFPFWGPFPAVPPPAAPPSATDAPQSSTEAPQASGKDILFFCQKGAGNVEPSILFCVCEFYQVAVRPPHQTRTLLLQLLLHRDPRCQAFPSPCLRLLPSPPHHGHLYRHFLPSVSTTVLSHLDNDATLRTFVIQLNASARL